MKKRIFLTVLVFFCCFSLFADFEFGSKGVDPLFNKVNRRNILGGGVGFNFGSKLISLNAKMRFFGRTTSSLFPIHGFAIDVDGDINKSKWKIGLNLGYEFLIGSIDCGEIHAPRRIFRDSDYILFYGTIGIQTSIGKADKFAFGPYLALTVRHWFNNRFGLDLTPKGEFDISWLTDNNKLNNIGSSDYTGRFRFRLNAAFIFRF